MSFTVKITYTNNYTTYYYNIKRYDSKDNYLQLYNMDCSEVTLLPWRNIFSISIVRKNDG